MFALRLGFIDFYFIRYVLRSFMKFYASRRYNDQLNDKERKREYFDL